MQHGAGFKATMKTKTLAEIAAKLDWEGGLGEGLLYFGREIDSVSYEFNCAWRQAYDAFMAVEKMLPDFEDCGACGDETCPWCN
jgi:hypothetical protein